MLTITDGARHPSTVIDLYPGSGVRDLGVMKTLADYRRHGELAFDVNAEVTVPGRVGTGDPAILAKG